jgi:hypothetical protein
MATLSPRHHHPSPCRPCQHRCRHPAPRPPPGPVTANNHELLNDFAGALSSQGRRRVAHYQDAINERAVTIDGGGCAPARSKHSVIATPKNGTPWPTRAAGQYPGESPIGVWHDPLRSESRSYSENSLRTATRSSYSSAGARAASVFFSLRARLRDRHPASHRRCNAQSEGPSVLVR